MQEQHLYEYAVIRLVPLVEREEFINVGVIVYSKAAAYLDCKYHLDENRISCLQVADLDLKEIRAHLDSFVAIAKGQQTAHPVSLLDMASRFRWLTAVRSTVVQTSRIHPGQSLSLPDTFDRLFTQMVL